MDPIARDDAPSSIIRKTLKSTGGKELTVEGLVAAFGDQSFGFLLVMMALPLVIPLPPGVAFLPASCLLIWSLQRLLGKTTPWIPRFIALKPVSPALTRTMEKRGIPLCELVERYCYGKKQSTLREREIRLAALIVVFMSMLIMLPTPFLNSIPALLTFVMGLAILANNRMLVWVFIPLGLVVMFAIGSTVYLGAEMLVDEVEELIELF